ncbi:unnamed protein product [Paramecium octaurelia]|uniref:Uncharacterized protein n=1 Tax=Paramecium octaurelia TaxID=43137 RepID=A0A8S1Y5N5_PAROT|nr:unnamed protein product [Paramecium octaurelia]
MGNICKSQKDTEFEDTQQLQTVTLETGIQSINSTIQANSQQLNLIKESPQEGVQINNIQVIMIKRRRGHSNHERFAIIWKQNNNHPQGQRGEGECQIKISNQERDIKKQRNKCDQIQSSFLQIVQRLIKIQVLKKNMTL